MGGVKERGSSVLYQGGRKASWPPRERGPVAEQNRRRRNPPASTEVDAYIFIKRKLKELGWNTGHPERNPDGQVYTQNECLSNKYIKRALGLDRPENIVRLTDEKLWVIEAKRYHLQLDQAVSEARQYAERLIADGFFSVPLISGVAGNDDDGFMVRTQFLLDGTWTTVQINSIETTGLLSPDECQALLDSNQSNIEDPPIDDRRFVQTAERINRILHKGSVNPHQRANVVSALLLSMLNQDRLDLNVSDTSVLIANINIRVQRVLENQGKSGFHEYIKIPLPAATDNHVKYRRALIESLQELRGLNIHSAMQSGEDWLGTFYEVFLKYARWAQDLGVVLTPRHITRFAARVMSIHSRDIVYDPTCGTGGFLVSAFEEVKKTSTPSQVENFKRNSVFGLEQDDGIAALAIVNMIFRGDGKNNIEQANCLAQYLASASGLDGPTAEFIGLQSDHPPVTKVLMNPPFAQADKEYEFVTHALRQMEDHGLLFSILPYSVMVKPGSYRTWRRNLLHENTLLAVVTFPIDIFYPVSAPPVGIFVRKGIPHHKNQRTLWIRAETDGHLKTKGKRLPSSHTTNQLEDCIPTLRAFLHDPSLQVDSKPRHIISAPVDFDDDLFELVPEAYLEQEEISDADVLEGVDRVLRDCAAFLVRNRIPSTWDEEEE